MVRSKYTEENVSKIIEGIRRGGTDRAGWDGIISKDTFYQWIARYPAFSDRITQARKEFQDNCSEDVKSLARTRIFEYLAEGQRERWVETETIQHYKIDEQGNEILTGIDRKVRERNFERPTPQWVFDKILGKELPLLDALKQLINDEILPPEQMRKVAVAFQNFEGELKKKLSNNEEKPCLIDKSNNE